MSFLDTFNSVKGNLNSLSQIRDSLNKYIVRPINSFGIGGFVFDNEGEASHNLSSEITDHYVEDNSAVQDHWAIKPDKIILKNYVGELVYRLDENTETTLQKLDRKLTIVNDYLPKLSKGAEQLKAALDVNLNFDNISALAGKTDLWALTKNLNPPTTRQEQAFMFFKALRDQKMPVSVQTPFEFKSNLAIETVVAMQGGESKYIGDFTITLKELRTVSTRTIRNPKLDFVGPMPASPDPSGPPANYQGGSKFQREVPINLGETQGLSVPVDEAQPLTESGSWLSDDSQLPE